IEKQLAGVAVQVTRCKDGWRATIPELRVTRHRRRLANLDRVVRDILGVAPNAWVNYEFQTGNPTLDRYITMTRACRRAAMLADLRERQHTLPWWNRPTRCPNAMSAWSSGCPTSGSSSYAGRWLDRSVIARDLRAALTGRAGRRIRPSGRTPGWTG